MYTKQITCAKLSFEFLKCCSHKTLLLDVKLIQFNIVDTIGRDIVWGGMGACNQEKG
jgi:hypothetical protein